MPFTITAQVNVSAFGQQYLDDQSTDADAGVPIAPSIAAAKTGALTTRTSTSVGTLTMDAGHGITTGAIIDLFWDGGSRADVLVGTVATNSVPFTLGSGDDLPVADTEITAMVSAPQDAVAVGDDLVAFGFRSNDSAAIFTVCEADGTTVLLTVRLDANSSYQWNENNGVTNPLAGAAIGAVRTSHANSDSAETMNGFFAYN